ncbi:hypothetical protein [Caulobacter mirabilis]|uniref:Uncharacterized protein n=1 Tax=Caulobacter mirabilis TaxID=69666 RepID=A0A2D2AVV9_9CAUL|nr:hypothetical protein [Caulobacter mirabilis]ATQ42111.1 hypothetical protein CSW64_06615 [Caulobacter mirabilis]
MTISRLVRTAHRWISIAFTAGVITYIVVMTQGTPPIWLGLFALVPLILLLVSGLYLFVLPYVTRARAGAAKA